MSLQYQIVGHCANFSVTFPDGRRGRQMLFKGQLVPPTATPQEIAHHLSVGLIKPLAGQAETEPPVQEPTVTSTVQPAEPTGGDGGSGETPPAGDGDGGEAPEGEAEQAGQRDGDAERKWDEAVAKARALAAAGSKPDGRTGQLVLAAWLVDRGYDRAAVEKAGKSELLDLAKSLSQ